jgi:hypothetical protein
MFGAVALAIRSKTWAMLAPVSLLVQAFIMIFESPIRIGYRRINQPFQLDAITKIQVGTHVERLE